MDLYRVGATLIAVMGAAAIGQTGQETCYQVDRKMVPLAGIEPALLAELDFESSASTNSATGAFGRSPWGEGREAGGI
jgi:hypothetical protein